MIMDEKEKAQQIQEPSEGEEQKETVKSKTQKVVDDTNAAAERIEKATEEMRKENSRHEEIMAKQALGGRAEAGSAPKKERETDEEYAERFKKGEVDPFVDDGFK